MKVASLFVNLWRKFFHFLLLSSFFFLLSSSLQSMGQAVRFRLRRSLCSTSSILMTTSPHIVNTIAHGGGLTLPWWEWDSDSPGHVSHSRVCHNRSESEIPRTFDIGHTWIAHRKTQYLSLEKLVIQDVVLCSELIILTQQQAPRRLRDEPVRSCQRSSK